MKWINQRQGFLRGFTLVELLIAVVIIAIVSVMGINSITGRITSANVEESAKTLASDLSYARSAANLKGCPTRFIMCSNKNCTDQPGTPLSSAGSPAFIGASASAPAQYYGILRQSTPCAASDSVAGDNYANWDFNAPEQARPRSIPNGVVFRAIYDGGGVLSGINGTVASNSLVVGNSLWFSASLNPSMGTLPVTNGLTSTGNYIAFQLQMAGCDPKATDDCLGIFVTISPGGVTGIRRCVTGSRANNTDVCF